MRTRAPLALSAVAFAALAAASVGCAFGSADEEFDGGPRGRAEFGTIPEDGSSDSNDESRGDDAEPDAVPIFETDPGAGCFPACAPMEECLKGKCTCVPKCTTCGSADGCGGKCTSGTCPTGAVCASGSCVKPTNSYLSPGGYVGSAGAYARGLIWTIASETPSTIFYTTDGSAPGPGGPSKSSPADLYLATSGTKLRWYADNGAKETAHEFVVKIDGSLQSGYGFVVDAVKLDSVGPVVVVSPGATITGRANYEAWVGTGCPGCRMQLVYGIGNTSAGCVYDWSPGTWGGASGTDTALKMTAPAAPGVYKLNVTYTLELSCANGMAKNPLNVRPTAEVATIVVK